MVKFFKVAVTSYDYFTEEQVWEAVPATIPELGLWYFESGILAERKSIVQVRLGAREK